MGRAQLSLGEPPEDSCENIPPTLATADLDVRAQVGMPGALENAEPCAHCCIETRGRKTMGWEWYVYNLLTATVLVAAILMTVMRICGQRLRTIPTTSLSASRVRKELLVPERIYTVSDPQTIAITTLWAILAAVFAGELARLLYGTFVQPANSQRSNQPANAQPSSTNDTNGCMGNVQIIKKARKLFARFSINGSYFWYKVHVLSFVDLILQAEALSVYGGLSILSGTIHAPVQEPPVLIVHALLVAISISAIPLCCLADNRVLAEIIAAGCDIGFTVDQILTVTPMPGTSVLDARNWYIFREESFLGFATKAWPLLGLLAGLSSLQAQLRGEATDNAQNDACGEASADIGFGSLRGGHHTLASPAEPATSVGQTSRSPNASATSAAVASHQGDALTSGSRRGARCVSDAYDPAPAQAAAKALRSSRVRKWYIVSFPLLSVALLSFVCYQQFGRECSHLAGADDGTDCRWVARPLWGPCDCHALVVPTADIAANACIEVADVALQSKPRVLYVVFTDTPMNLPACAITDARLHDILAWWPLLQSLNAAHQQIQLRDPARLPAASHVAYLNLLRNPVQSLAPGLDRVFPALDRLYLENSQLARMDVPLFERWAVRQVQIFGSPICSARSSELAAVQEINSGVTCDAVALSAQPPEVDAAAFSCGGFATDDPLHVAFAVVREACVAYHADPRHDCTPTCQGAHAVLQYFDKDSDGFFDLHESNEWLAAYGHRAFEDLAEMECLVAESACQPDVPPAKMSMVSLFIALTSGADDDGVEPSDCAECDFGER